jgi:metal-responsive CopG/Arc/MetJ family transcriptional regulator
MPKITLNLEDTILKALKLKATETNQSMSELVNDALKASLQEDLEDIKSWEECKGEDTYDYEEFVELLKKDGVL